MTNYLCLRKAGGQEYDWEEYGDRFYAAVTALITVIVLRQRLENPPPWESELSRQFCGEEPFRKELSVTVTGQVYEKEVRTLYGEEILILYLRSVTVSSDTESGTEYLSRIFQDKK